jgi:hypothetical protein
MMDTVNFGLGILNLFFWGWLFWREVRLERREDALEKREAAFEETHRTRAFRGVGRR